MLRKIVPFLSIFLAILVFGIPVMAQAKTSLNIECNMAGAKVYLNEKLAGYTNPNFSMLIQPGTYVVRVSKDGYEDFTTTITAETKPITLKVTFGSASTQPPPPPPPPVSYQLQVISNISGAQVFINGTYQGNTPFNTALKPGSYTIEIRASGYQTYTKIVTLNSPFSLYAQLEKIMYPISITVSGGIKAQLYRDNVYIGTTPYVGTWTQGTYSIRLSAPGFQDYILTHTIGAPFSLQIALTPIVVDYEIVIPDIFLQMLGRKTDINDLDIFIDNQRIYTLKGKIAPGNHRFAIYYRSFGFEAEFNLDPSKSLPEKPYIITPFFGLRVTQ